MSFSCEVKTNERYYSSKPGCCPYILESSSSLCRFRKAKIEWVTGLHPPKKSSGKHCCVRQYQNLLMYNINRSIISLGTIVWSLAHFPRLAHQHGKPNFDLKVVSVRGH